MPKPFTRTTCSFWQPSGMRTCTFSSSKMPSISISAPRVACTMETFARACRLSPSRSKNSCGWMRHVTMRSPGRAPCMPASPKPDRRSCWASRMPTGTSTVTRWRSGTRPCPSHSGHGFSMVWPVPPQVLHVVAVCMSPRKVCWMVTTRPWPWQSGQVISRPSGPRPDPSQSGHGARRSYTISFLAPAATSSSVRRRPTPMSRPSLRIGARPAACPPKKELKMSPMPNPPPNRSSKST